jgi:NADPH-dependent curcumin reductase CurA
MNTRQIILQSRPLGAPTLQDFKIEDTTLEEMQWEVLLKGLYYSVDPTCTNEWRQIFSAFKINEPLEGGVVATVVESKPITLK